MNDLRNWPSVVVRCNLCCGHGIPHDRWCGWCADLMEFGMADCLLEDGDEQWKCYHEYSSKHSKE